MYAFMYFISKIQFYAVVTIYMYVVFLYYNAARLNNSSITGSCIIGSSLTSLREGLIAIKL